VGTPKKREEGREEEEGPFTHSNVSMLLRARLDERTLASKDKRGKERGGEKKEKEREKRKGSDKFLFLHSFYIFKGESRTNRRK